MSNTLFMACIGHFVKILTFSSHECFLSLHRQLHPSPVMDDIQCFNSVDHAVAPHVRNVIETSSKTVISCLNCHRYKRDTKDNWRLISDLQPSVSSFPVVGKKTKNASDDSV